MQGLWHDILKMLSHSYHIDPGQFWYQMVWLCVAVHGRHSKAEFVEKWNRCGLRWADLHDYSRKVPAPYKTPQPFLPAVFPDLYTAGWRTPPTETPPRRCIVCICALHYSQQPGQLRLPVLLHLHHPGTTRLLSEKCAWMSDISTSSFLLRWLS